MKKKAIKIAAASAVAASAIVASAPAQSFAATSVAVTVDNAVLQMKKAFFTYNTPATQGQIADIAAVRAEYAKAKSMYATARTAVVKAGNVKLLDKLDGYYADFIQKKVITYIDAYTYGENYLKANKDGLQNAINAKNYDDVAKFSKELSYQLNSSRRTIIDRVYGPDTRALFRATYTEGAKKLNDTILVDVEVYNSIVKLNDAVAKKDLAAGKVEVDNINKLLPTVTSALKEDLTAKANTAVSAYNALVPAAVDSVTFLNGVTLQVKFNKEVAKADAENPLTYDLSGKTLVKAVLGSDNKTVTLTYNSTQVTDATLTINQVATKADANVKTAKYVSKVTYADTVAPTVAGVDYTYNKDNAGKVVSANAVFNFSEPLSTEGVISLGGVQLTTDTTKTNYYEVNLAEGTVTIHGLAVGSTFKVDMVGAKDVAGNMANSISQSITVPAQTVDTVKPTVAATINGNMVTLQFSKEVVAKADKTIDATVKINGVDVSAAFKQDSTDKAKWTLDVQHDTTLLNSVTFAYATVTVENFKDKAGNTGDKFTSAQGVLTKKTAAPTFVSAVTSNDNKKLLLTFNEAVFKGDLTTLTNELSLKVLDNVYKSTTLDLTDTNVAYGYDLDGKNGIDGAEKNIVAIDVTALPADVLTSGALTAKSNYTFELAKNVVADYYGNKVASALTINLTVPEVGSANYTPQADVTFVLPAPPAPQEITATGGVFTLTFSRDMGDSAVNATNYTFDGKALPAGTTLRFVGDRKHVEVALPKGYISVSGKYQFVATGLTSTKGDTLANGRASVVVNANDTVAPTATKVTLLDSRNLTVDFSEFVTTNGAAVSGVTVKVNGTDQVATFTLGADGVLRIALTLKDVAPTDTITVEFKDTNIVDVSGNKLANGSINK